MQDIACFAHAVFMPCRLVDRVVEVTHIDAVLGARAFGDAAACPHHPDCSRRLQLRGLNEDWGQ